MFKIQHKSSKKFFAAKTMRSDKINSSTKRSLQMEIDILKKVSHTKVKVILEADNNTVQSLVDQTNSCCWVVYHIPKIV